VQALERWELEVAALFGELASTGAQVFAGLNGKFIMLKGESSGFHSRSIFVHKSLLLLQSARQLLDSALAELSVGMPRLPGARATWQGTGFFVAAGGASFLVSAAHVLDHITASGALHYYVDQKRMRKVTGQLLRTKPRVGRRNDDRLDIGVVKLEGHMPYLPVD